MILVAIGGFFGAVTRYYLGKVVTSSYPWATLSINLTGSFALGLLYGLHPSLWLWQLVGIGFLGAYTTFSTFGFETLQMLQEKKYMLAIFYVTSSVMFGLLFAMLGLWVVK